VTVEGDETDYWLRAGDLLQLPPLRHAVIEADGKEVSELSMLTADLHHATTLPVTAQTALNQLKQWRRLPGNVFRFSSVISQNQKKGSICQKQLNPCRK
jgi:hypothetical protein